MALQHRGKGISFFWVAFARKGPSSRQDVARVEVEQPFIPFADRVGFDAFIAIARHSVIDRRQELHLVQFAFCKAVIQIDMIRVVNIDRIIVGSLHLEFWAIPSEYSAGCSRLVTGLFRH